MTKSKTLKVPSWLGRIECRHYKNRRDLYSEIGLLYVTNYPHEEVVFQLEQLYVVKYDETKSGRKIGFEVVGLSELGEITLRMKSELEEVGSSFDKIIFCL